MTASARWPHSSGVGATLNADSPKKCEACDAAWTTPTARCKPRRTTCRLQPQQPEQTGPRIHREPQDRPRPPHQVTRKIGEPPTPWKSWARTFGSPSIDIHMWHDGARSSRRLGRRHGSKRNSITCSSTGPGTIDYNGCTLLRWDRTTETVVKRRRRALHPHTITWHTAKTRCHEFMPHCKGCDVLLLQETATPRKHTWSRMGSWHLFHCERGSTYGVPTVALQAEWAQEVYELHTTRWLASVTTNVHWRLGSSPPCIFPARTTASTSSWKPSTR